MYRADPWTIRDRVNQSSIKKFFNLFFNDVVDLGINSSLMLYRWPRGTGFCWGMMVEVCGSSGEWWKLSRNVGKGVAGLAGILGGVTVVSNCGV
nr:hypothetical protein [Tanacetum cinerariifolium]